MVDGTGGGDDERLTVVLPARLEADRIATALANLLSSDLALPLDVAVVCNGPVDGTEAVVEAERSLIESRGWTVRVDRVDEPGKCASIRHGARLARPGPVVVLDVRVGLQPATLGRLIDGCRANGWDVASARLAYVVAGDAVCRSFARAYAATPFGRSTDLKGTCVAVMPNRRDVLTELPDVPAEDRYYLSQVAADRRGTVVDAVVDYHFPLTVGALVRQQTRWAAANRGTVPLMDDHDRPAHEAERRPYFGSEVPAVRDRVVYGAIAASTRAAARLRPMRSSAW